MKWQRGAQAKSEHRHGNLGQIAPLRREQRRRSERRPDAGAPNRAEQKPHEQLSRNATVLRGADIPAAPVRNRRAGNGELGLQARYQENCADRDHQYRRNVAKDAEIEAQHHQHKKVEAKPEAPVRLHGWIIAA